MRTSVVSNTSLQKRIETYQMPLEKEHGPIIGGTTLRVKLGFKTAAAFRQAVKRDKLPVPVFKLPKRRGHFARVIDIATWLAEIDEMVENSKQFTKRTDQPNTELAS